MPDQNIFLFALFIASGFLIIVLGFRFSHTTRKVIETIGAVIFHVGIFGILYHRVETSLFVGLITFVIALFVLMDPLKIANYLNAKVYKLFGWLILFTSTAFGLQFLIGFPVWPWMAPIVIYLSPYLISPLKKAQKTINALALLTVFAYLAIIAFVLYGTFSTRVNNTVITKHFSTVGYLFSKPQPVLMNMNQTNINTFEQLEPVQEQIPSPPTDKPDTTTHEKSAPVPVIIENVTAQTAEDGVDTQSETKKPNNTGPFLGGLQKADDDYLSLKKDHEELMKKYEQILKENNTLRQELEKVRAHQGQTQP